VETTDGDRRRKPTRDARRPCATSTVTTPWCSAAPCTPGRWCDAARDFAERLAEPLVDVPTWLFSSGPLGTTDPTPDADPIDAAPMLELTGAESHRIFTGKLDTAGLSFGEKAVVRALHAPVGDFRDWGAIDAYAREIAMQLVHQAPGPPNSSAFPSVR
jgi:hypothetical protein